MLSALALAAVLNLPISNDHGGYIRWYFPAIRYYVAQGYEFRVEGLCASACTYVFIAPREQLCVTKDAVFQFHAASNPDGSSAASTGTAFLWAAYPLALRKRVGRLTDRIVTVHWPETAQFARVCDD